MALFYRLLINITGITAIVCAFNAMAADDEYLKMLEDEAKGLEVDKSGQLEQPADNEVSPDGVMNINLKGAGALEGGVLPTGLTQDEFIEVLRNNFYGSFVFYQKLDSNDQQTVYYNYSKSSPAYLDSVRQDILDHLKNR